MITARDAAAFAAAIERGGVALFPADTVYGLACDPDAEDAVHRLYDLKGRAPDKPAAVMWFGLDRALAALPEVGRRTRAALLRLLPGGVTVLLSNPERRFPLACGPDIATLGVRVPALADALAPLAAVSAPALQTSANRAGDAAPRRFADVDPALREGVDCALDGGELPGTASTVVDLRAYEHAGRWTVVRAGAVRDQALRLALEVEAP